MTYIIRKNSRITWPCHGTQDLSSCVPASAPAARSHRGWPVLTSPHFTRPSYHCAHLHPHTHHITTIPSLIHSTPEASTAQKCRGIPSFVTIKSPYLQGSQQEMEAYKWGSLPQFTQLYLGDQTLSLLLTTCFVHCIKIPVQAACRQCRCCMNSKALGRWWYARL